jgi:hypothetical protein
MFRGVMQKEVIDCRKTGLVSCKGNLRRWGIRMGESFVESPLPLTVESAFRELIFSCVSSNLKPWQDQL